MREAIEIVGEETFVLEGEEVDPDCCCWNERGFGTWRSASSYCFFFVKRGDFSCPVVAEDPEDSSLLELVFFDETHFVESVEGTLEGFSSDFVVFVAKHFGCLSWTQQHPSY